MSRKSFFPTVPVLPSKSLNKKWIRVSAFRKREEEEIPEEEDDILYESEEDLEESDDEDGKVTTTGKWMLFLDITHESVARGMTHHDYAWQYIKKLVETRGKQVGLFSAKCSTGWAGHHTLKQTPDSLNGVICCYTPDFNNKVQVKKAGDAIREVVAYQRDMFYKTDNDTRAGIYARNGHKFVTIYKHTQDFNMFERDKIVPYHWNRVYV